MTEFGATNGDTEPDRYDRLTSVWAGVLAFVAAITRDGSRELALSVKELNDHKGTLTITWTSDMMREKYGSLFASAWTWAGEHEGAVVHEIASR